MPIDATSKTSSASATQGPSPFTSSASIMTPEQIIALCARTLNSLGDQLNDYKDLVMKKQEKAGEIRQALSDFRSLNEDGGDLTLEDVMKHPEQYNAMMANLEKNKNDPQVANLYKTMVDTFGPKVGIGADGKGTVQVDINKLPPAMEAVVKQNLDFGFVELSPDNIDKYLNSPGGSEKVSIKAENLTKVEKDMEGVLTSLNSDNELVMMNLQQIMQQRNQASQLYASLQSSMNETMKSIIGKIG